MSRRRWSIIAMALLPVIWLLAWYVAWLVRVDCFDGLLQIEFGQDALRDAVSARCEAAEVRHRLVGVVGALAVLGAELAIWRGLPRAGPAMAIPWWGGWLALAVAGLMIFLVM